MKLQGFNDQVTLEFCREFNGKNTRLKDLWDKFFLKFQGFNDEVTLEFSREFIGKNTRLKDLVLEVIGK